MTKKKIFLYKSHFDITFIQRLPLQSAITITRELHFGRHLVLDGYRIGKFLRWDSFFVPFGNEIGTDYQLP
jgi:hypothetical protein